MLTLRQHAMIFVHQIHLPSYNKKLAQLLLYREQLSAHVVHIPAPLDLSALPLVGREGSRKRVLLLIMLTILDDH